MSKLEDTGERLIPEGNERTLTYGEHIARYNSVKKLVEGKIVVDVASGTGYGTKIMSFHASKVIGIDNSKSAIEYSKRHHFSEKIEYLVGDALKLPLDSSSVDVVVSFETIEHLPDQKKFIKEVKRILKPDGIFIVSTPNEDEFMEGNEFHLHEFTLKELKKLISNNFKHNQFFYQSSWFSTGLLGESKFTKSFAENIYTTKTFSDTKGKALFFICVAGNSEIPNLDENIVVADTWSMKASQELANRHTEEVEILVRKVLETERREKALYDNNMELRADIERIYNSMSWRSTKFIRDMQKLVRRKSNF